MKDEFSFYIGVDWGAERHQLCIMDPEGRVIGEQNIKHSGHAIGDFLGSWTN